MFDFIGSVELGRYGLWIGGDQFLFVLGFVLSSPAPFSVCIVEVLSDLKS